ncbi:MAG: Gldg family protein, partial [Deltaproteobacteria bacterium]|nr:Gldg family protein [Deltaproteobacteria bacterium]
MALKADTKPVPLEGEARAKEQGAPIRPARGCKPAPTGGRFEPKAFAAVATGAGWLLLLLGERVLEPTVHLATVLSALGAASLVAGLGARLLTLRRSGPDRRPSAVALAWLSGAGLVAGALYFATTGWGRELLRLGAPKVGGPDTFGDVVTVVWLGLLVFSLCGTVLGELALWSMQRAERVESRRVTAAVTAGLALAAAILYGALFTYSAGTLELRADFSYFRTAKPSEATRKMIAGLGEPLTALAFFPPLNDVGTEVLGYLSDLRKGSEKLKVESYDRLVAPDVAKDNNVRSDGVVVLVRGKTRESVEIGTEMERAAPKLKKLDGDMQKALLKVMRERRTAYLSVGHGELNELGDSRAGRSAQGVRRLLESQLYLVKDLGLTQGLATDVPEDATIVLVLGPSQPFLPEEIAALARYAKRGGKLLLALDPDGKADLDPLAALVGLKWQGALLAHDTIFLRRGHTPADKTILATNRFSSHAAVSTLSKYASRAAVALAGCAPLDKRDGADGALKIDFAVKSMPGTYLDLSGNFEFDKDTEKRQVYNVVAAVRLPVADTKAEKGAKKEEGKPGAVPDEMRAFVLGDADALSDAVFANEANVVLLLDAVRWLGGEESFSGEVSTTEDVRIVHTKAEDQIWFYTTILGVPLVVLGAGLFVTWRGRQRRRPAAARPAGAPGAGKAEEAEPAKDEGETAAADEGETAAA